MKKIVIAIIMAVIMTATAVALDNSATKKYNAAQAATASYPYRYEGMARVYSRDVEEFAWSKYMDSVDWLDANWKGDNEVVIRWFTGKEVCHPNQDPEPVVHVIVNLANGTSTRTYLPAKAIYS